MQHYLYMHLKNGKYDRVKFKLLRNDGSSKLNHFIPVVRKPFEMDDQDFG